MTARIPSFGMPGLNPVQTNQDNSVIPVPTQFANAMGTIGVRPGLVFAVKANILSDCPYSQVHRQMEPMQFGSSYAEEFLQKLVEQVEQRVAQQLDSQKVELTTQITGAKDAMLAKKSNSLVTLNGSVFGLGKFTEAWTKTVEVVQGLGKAFGPESNVDNASFPRQLGRSMVNGAKGMLKISAGALAAAAVAAALLTTAGVALDKGHEVVSSVPSSAQVVGSVKAVLQDIKVSVGPVEVENTAKSEARPMTMAERATGLLAQNGNNYAETIKMVQARNAVAFMDGNRATLESGQKLLDTLQTMQTAAQASAAVISAGAVGPTP